MTDKTHPITPPPALVEQWLAHAPNPLDRLGHVATQAANWGADQELDACRKWVDEEFPMYPKCDGPASYRLANARRPQPPSLAEQALNALQAQIDGSFKIAPKAQERADLIRRALERLQELEQENHG